MMVGRTVDMSYPRNFAEKPGKVLLEVKGLAAASGISDIDLEVRAGEIVGLCGLVGSGRTEVARAIFGADKVTAGEIIFDGQRMSGGPDQAARRGIALIPENRKSEGLALLRSVGDNLVVSALRKLFPSRSVRAAPRAKRSPTAWSSNCGSQPRASRQTVGLLSGGNQQKVVIGKWLAAGAKLFIFDEPTRGIDVGAKSEIFALIDRLVADGAAALMISSEQAEICHVCDRAYVMREGRIAGAIVAPRADRRKHREAGDASCVKPPPSLPGNPLQRIPGVAVMLALLVVVFGSVAPGFLSPANISNVLVQSTILTMLALPMTLIIMTEGLDLSMGAVLTLTSLVVAIVSLATRIDAARPRRRDSGRRRVRHRQRLAGRDPRHSAVRGDARHAGHGAGPVADRQRRPERGRHPAQRARHLFGDASLGVPVPVVMALSAYAAFHVLLYHTRFGTYIFALGGNREALRYAGLSPNRLLIAVYALGGTMAGVAGLLMTARMNSGHPTAGLGLEFDAIAAVAVGGTSFERGNGWLFGTVLGVIAVGVLRNGLNLMALPSSIQVASVGAPRHRRAVPRRIAEPVMTDMTKQAFAPPRSFLSEDVHPGLLPAARRAPDLRRRCRS